MQKKLTPKETDILKLLAKGYSSREIAIRLENSKKTIDNMRNQILIKTKSKNVAHLVSWGYQNDILLINIK